MDQGHNPVGCATADPNFWRGLLIILVVIVVIAGVGVLAWQNHVLRVKLDVVTDAARGWEADYYHMQDLFWRESDMLNQAIDGWKGCKEGVQPTPIPAIPQG